MVISRILVVTLMAAVLLLSAGCTGSAVKEYTSPNQPIEVTAGEQFMIYLESNPTTGYKWEASFDTAFLKLVKSEYKQNESKPGMVGVGGIEQFLFQGLKAGDTQIKLTYKRPWEQQSADAKVLTFTVKVK
jgi:inhibitor of cysteine peptidase